MTSEPDSLDTQCGYCGKQYGSRCYPMVSMQGSRYFIYHCPDCKAYYLAPRPTADQLMQCYDSNYYGGQESKFPPLIESILDFFRKSRSRRIQRYVSSPARILDIGCGNGRFLSYLIEKGYEGYGIELSGKVAERAAANPGLKLKQGSMEPGDFPENYFDAVSMWHVFEHLTEPRRTLEIISSILKPGGYLFLSLPNIQSWQSRLFKGRWLHLDPPRHLFFFAPEDLIRLLGTMGYTFHEKTTFSLEQNPFGIQQSLLNCFCAKRDVLFEYLKGNRSYTKEYSALVLWCQKTAGLLTSPIFIVLAMVESAFGAGGTMEMVFQIREQ